MQRSDPDARDEAGRYSTTAIVLHWLVVVGVIVTIVFGWTMQAIPKNPVGPRVTAFNLHKSIGITILLLMVARVIWRATHSPPALPPMPLWQARAAKISHVLLYVCLFVIPIGGFTASSFSGRPIVYFGHALPVLAGRNDSAAQVFYAIHSVASWILIALIALHVAAALKHQFIDRDGLLRRMWPRAVPEDPELAEALRHQ